MAKKRKQLQDVWDYVEGGDYSSLGDVADIKRGPLKEKNRPVGECWPCKKFADEAFIHESPGTAGCCRGCDAYKG